MSYKMNQNRFLKINYNFSSSKKSHQYHKCNNHNRINYIQDKMNIKLRKQKRQVFRRLHHKWYLKVINMHHIKDRNQTNPLIKSVILQNLKAREINLGKKVLTQFNSSINNKAQNKRRQKHLRKKWYKNNSTFINILIVLLNPI